MKKALFFSILSLACCISASCSSEDLSILNNNSAKLQQTSLKGEAEALSAWNRLKETFGYSRTVSDSIKYPDYYGGSYIEDGQLIVYIVKGNNKKTPQLLNSDPIFVVKECDYSYNELLKATNEVSEFMVSEKNTENPIREKLSLCSLSETFNRVEVYVSDLSPSFISEFKKQVSNSPAIKFIISPQCDDFENIVPTPIIIDDNPQPLGITYINPGDFIYMTKTSSSQSSNEASAGYKAINNDGVIGFLTAAHAANLNDNVAWGTRTEAHKVGKVIASTHSGNVDAAFCQITNAYFDFQSRCQSIAYKNSQLKEGVVLHLVGGYNQTVGTIRSLNTTSNANIKGLISAYYTSQSGDSGGYVYYEDPYGNELTAGIHHGHGLVQNPDGTYVTVGLCCAAEEIEKSMGLIPCK